MQRTIYALLVGIDNYPSPISSLQGCVNDINRMNEFLEGRIKESKDTYKPRILKSEQATRKAIIEGFRKHLNNANSNDVALFYYSGHGSQQVSPSEFWHLEPDRLDETIVCYDSRSDGSWDLADKELAQLIYEVAAKDPHILVVLDSCHSGGGTRVIESEAVNIRLAKNDHRNRPVSTFIINPEQADKLQKSYAAEITSGNSGWAVLPKGRHIVLSGCRSNELSREIRFEGERRGVFSYYLLDALKRTNGVGTYRDIFKRANALVRASVSMQSPQMEASQLSDLEQSFLGGAIQSMEPYFTMSKNGNDWEIDGGIIHGIEKGNEQEKTVLAVFPFNHVFESRMNLELSIGQVEVQKVFPGRSIVSAGNGIKELLDPTYKAVLISLPLIPLMICIEGNESGSFQLREAIKKAGPNLQPSLFIQEGDIANATLRVSILNDKYRISRIGDNYSLIVDIPVIAPNSADLVVTQLEHIARWLKILQLTNKLSRISSNAVQLDIMLTNKNGKDETATAGSEVLLEYQYQNQRWQEPKFKIKIKNTSSVKLYCVLLDLPESYGVFLLLDGGGIWLEPGEEVFVISGNGSPVFYANIPDPLWNKGLLEMKDTLKLIASTEEVDATLLAQEDLNVELVFNKGTRSITPANMLERLLYRVGTRHFTSNAKKDEVLVDWITSEVSFTTIRPKEATDVAGSGKVLALSEGVELAGHSQLKAKIRLSTISNAGRDVHEVSLPSILRNNSYVEPFELISSGERGEPGLSVLELYEVQDHTVVSQEEPLVIKTKIKLSSGEHVLPVAFDGEFYLPLGFASGTETGTEIRLTRLPNPILAGNRSLHGSMKIFFQKIISEHIGLEYSYPLLAEAVHSNGKLSYNLNKTELQQKIANAKRILLCIHGAFGDAKAMASSMSPDLLNHEVAAPSLFNCYDVVLTFDYENINTTVEDNARLLKQRLVEAGLSSNHGKTLQVIAHGMGGLVSRWFMEREGGNEMVQHLVMVGTPNGGSPWSTIQDWATAVIGIALNSLSTVAWPATVLGSLVSAIETIDVALDQTKPGSDF